MAVYTPVAPCTFGLKATVGAVRPCRDSNGSQITFDSDGDTLIITRLPEFDPIKYDLGVIIHRSRSQKLFVYRRGKMTKTIPITIAAQDRFNYKKIEDYVDSKRGKILTYTDPDGDKIRGTFVGFEVNRDRTDKGYICSIQFETE